MKVPDDYQNDYDVDHLVKLEIWGFGFFVTKRFTKLYKDRLYEPLTSRIMIKIVKKLKQDTLVLDIGAHYGYYSLLAATRSKNTVYAFEPIPENIQILRKNIAVNKIKRVAVYPIALSNLSSDKVMRLSKASDSSSFSPHPTGQILRKLTVKTKTIDQILESHHVGLIKIDVEGHELETLNGGLKTIKRDKPTIIFEYQPDCQRLAGKKEGELLGWLNNLGYELWAIGEDANMIQKLQKSPHSQALKIFEPETYGNILAIPTGNSFIPTPILNYFGNSIEDSGIGILAEEKPTLIPKITNIELWWTKKERDYYKRESQRANWEITQFKRKWFYKLGQMIKKTRDQFFKIIV